MPPSLRVLARPAFSNRAGNPYNWLLYTHMKELGIAVDEHSRRRLLTGRYDVWHLHWPESPLNNPNLLAAAARVLGLLGMMEIARIRGMKVVWTIHNLSAHEEQHPRLARWFWKAFVRRLAGYISLSGAGEALALERFPGLAERPGFVVPIGHYRDVYPSCCTRAEARARLGIDSSATVLAFVGQIRPYKNVPALINAFGCLADANLRLLVAGEPRCPDAGAAVRAAAEHDPRVQLFLEFVPDRDIEVYVKAADVLVFPFTKMLNSASALLALSFDRPILVPAMPTLQELQSIVGSEWIQTYDGALSPDVLRDGINRIREATRPGRPPLERLSWPTLARKTLAAFATIVSPQAERVSIARLS